MRSTTGFLLALLVACVSSAAAQPAAGEGDAPRDGDDGPILAEDYDFDHGRVPELSRWTLVGQLGGGVRLADSGWPGDAAHAYYGIATGGGVLALSGRRRFDGLWVAQARLLLDYAPYSAQGLSPEETLGTGYYHAFAFQLELGALRMPVQDRRFFVGGGILVGARRFGGSFISVPTSGPDYDDSFWVSTLGIHFDGGVTFGDGGRFEALLRLPLQVSGIADGGLSEFGLSVLVGASFDLTLLAGG